MSLGFCQYRVKLKYKTFDLYNETITEKIGDIQLEKNLYKIVEKYIDRYGDVDIDKLCENYYPKND